MKISLLFLIGILLAATPVSAKKHVLYVGTYTDGMANGIFVYSFSDHSGKLKDLKIPTVSNNPSFLAIAPGKKFLYAVGELDNLGDNNSGGVAAFRIQDNYSLKIINHVLTYGANPCHVSVSPDGKLLSASNYTGGNLSLFRIEDNGGLSKLVQRIQDEGSGPFPERQAAPHVHSSQFAGKGKLLYAADLGIDQLKIFSVNEKADIPLTPYSNPFVKLPPGSGPRHFAFSSDGRYIYVINELASTISVLMKYGDDWKDIQDIKTLPKDFKGESWCADIHISADGRFVYGSNRGHNSIAVFKRDQVSGKLDLIEIVPVEGDWPRNFAIDPSGGFILVANQKSNNITVFKINQDTGKLKYTGIKVSNHAPVCLTFLK